MSVQGYLAIALHVPFFNENEYAGSLAILIPIDKLGKLYLDKIKIKGTGLGLSIVKGLITLLSGRIWVESEPENLAEGKAGGTTFYFSIPIQEDPPANH